MAIPLNDDLHIFQPRLFTCDQNFEMIMSVITGEDEYSMHVNGNFRSEGDYGALMWRSADTLSHPDFRRPTVNDFSDIKIETDFDMDGVKDMSTLGGMTMTLVHTNDTTSFVRLWLYVTGRPEDEWETATQLFPAGRTPGTETPTTGHFTLDFANLWDGWLPAEFALTDIIHHEGDEFSPSWDEEIWEWVEINDTEYWDIIHARGYSLNSPSWTWTQIDTSDIKEIQFGFTPVEYNSASPSKIPLGESRTFYCDFTNWTVTGTTFLMTLPEMREAHDYRIADAYDDVYNVTPLWQLEQLYRLGFRDKINFYVGASHYYDKTGDVTKPTPEGYVPYLYTLDDSRPFNDAFIAWYTSYCYFAYNLDFTTFINSIAMENADIPDDWKQLAADGTPAYTLWTPTPYLVSFCNDDALEFYKIYAEGVATISASAGLTPIIQFGEMWWWWQENDTPNQPPCWYDQSTRWKCNLELGKTLPEWHSSSDNYGGDEDVLAWLCQKIMDWIDGIRSYVVTVFPTLETTVLFFPPSVLDKDRVPAMIQKVNFPRNQYRRTSSTETFNFMQIEDYDWVIAGEWDKVKQSLEFAQSTMDYHYKQVQYFAGFANTYQDYLNWWAGTYLPAGLTETEYFELVWSRIYRAAVMAMNEELETFIWASTQVKRDNWVTPEMRWESRRTKLRRCEFIEIQDAPP